MREFEMRAIDVAAGDEIYHHSVGKWKPVQAVLIGHTFGQTRAYRIFVVEGNQNFVFTPSEMLKVRI